MVYAEISASSAGSYANPFRTLLQTLVNAQSPEMVSSALDTIDDDVSGGFGVAGGPCTGPTSACNPACNQGVCKG